MMPTPTRFLLCTPTPTTPTTRTPIPPSPLSISKHQRQHLKRYNTGDTSDYNLQIDVYRDMFFQDISQRKSRCALHQRRQRPTQLGCQWKQKYGGMTTYLNSRVVLSRKRKIKNKAFDNFLTAFCSPLVRATDKRGERVARSTPTAAAAVVRPWCRYFVLLAPATKQPKRACTLNCCRCFCLAFASSWAGAGGCRQARRR